MSVPELSEKAIEAAARASHEVNRVWCLIHGDGSQVEWTLAPEWQKESARLGVRGVAQGNTPRQSHEGWLRHKAETGWKYGPVKDEVKKEHPCFVKYDELPPAQRTKDLLFVTTVRSMLRAIECEQREETVAAAAKQEQASPLTRAERIEHIMSVADHAAVTAEIVLKFEAKLADTDAGRREGVFVSLDLMNALVDNALDINPAMLDPRNISEIVATRMSYRVTDTGRALKRRLKKALDAEGAAISPAAAMLTRTKVRKARASAPRRKTPPAGLSKASKAKATKKGAAAKKPSKGARR